MSTDNEYYSNLLEKRFEILRKDINLAQLIRDCAYADIVERLNKKYGIYETINIVDLFQDTNSMAVGLLKMWIRWLKDHEYIKEIESSEIKVGDFVKIKNLHLCFCAALPYSDDGIVKEITEANPYLSYTVQLLNYPTLTLSYAREELEKQNSDLFEKVLLFRINGAGDRIFDHFVYRKKK